MKTFEYKGYKFYYKDYYWYCNELKPSDLGTVTGLTLEIDKLLTGNEYILFSMYKKGMVDLNQWELESLDTLRDNILTTKGNITFNVTGIDSVHIKTN